MSELGLHFSRGWDESIDKKKGYFDSSWQHPDSWSDVILQGPHLGVSTPMIKQPNPTMKHNQDWSEIDLEAMPKSFIPATAFLPDHENSHYDSAYTHHKLKDGSRVADRAYFRFAWRKMAATTGFRTLYPAVIPRDSAVSGSTITGVNTQNSEKTIAAATVLSSILLDFVTRSIGTANIYASTVESLPFALSSHFRRNAIELTLRLNCLTSAYAPLWEEVTGTPWTVDTPIRKAWDRQQAQNEIDAMVALSLGITADELCMIYRTQFPVMRKYDQQNLFDANGRLVPKEIVKAEEKAASGSKGTPESLSEAERTWTHPQSGVEYVFEYPFKPMDREAELRKAYAKYEAVLAESEK